MGTLLVVAKAYAAAVSVARGPLKMRLAVAAVWVGIYFVGSTLYGRLTEKTMA